MSKKPIAAFNINEEHLVCPPSRQEFCRAIEERVARFSREFFDAFMFISRYPRSVSFFGSSRFSPDNPHSQRAEKLAAQVVKELGYAVVTGGSAGIMEAANRGAFKAKGNSVGLNIKLPQKQAANQYTTASLDFSYFFTRKVALSFAAEAYIFFPGGFGTLDEFFEIVTLVQTRKIRHIPIFLVGKDFWEPLQRFIRENVYELHRAVDKTDLELYHITDDNDEIIKAIKDVPVHDGGLHNSDHLL